MTQPDARHIGRCECGAIEFVMIGEPINTAFCYCTSCQLHTNSDKFFGLWVKPAKFQFTKGTPTTYVRKGDSGKHMEHKFCGVCGVTLAAYIEIADLYSVAANTLDDKDRYQPNMLIYTKHAAPWALYPPHVPKFDVLPPRGG